MSYASFFKHTERRVGTAFSTLCLLDFLSSFVSMAAPDSYCMVQITTWHSSPLCRMPLAHHMAPVSVPASISRSDSAPSGVSGCGDSARPEMFSDLSEDGKPRVIGSTDCWSLREGSSSPNVNTSKTNSRGS